MIGLTPRQADALRFIAVYCEARGAPPPLKAIAAAMGLGSQARVHYLVTGLCERGAVARGKKGKIEVLEALPIPRAPDGAPLYFVRIGQ